MSRKGVDQATGLPERDIAIIKLMSNFGGKTFLPVLEKTFWDGKKVARQQAADRISKLKNKFQLLRYLTTGLVEPRSAIVYTEAGKRLSIDMGGSGVVTSISPSTVNHQVIEQIAFYWLQLCGYSTKRTYIKDWKEQGYNHTPDLAYVDKNGQLVYVEVELSKKNQESYRSIYSAIERDGIKHILYVFENEKRMRQIGKLLPGYDMEGKLFYSGPKIRLITVDQLIEESKSGSVRGIDLQMLKGMGEIKESEEDEE